MITYKFSSTLTTMGFWLSFVSNMTLIYLTIFYIKKVTGTYKKMVIGFAISGLLFSAVELTSRPFSHNYNHCLIFFSVNTHLTSVISQKYAQILLAIWAGFYMQTIAFMTVQFIYRYFCLFESSKIKFFDGLYSLVWMMYPVFIGALYSLMTYTLNSPDEYSDGFVRDEIMRNYNLTVSELPRFMMVPYSSDGSLRYSNFVFLTLAVLMINSHYFIGIYCGIRMHYNMKKELKKFSIATRQLHQQFFKALIIQAMGPTFFLIIPAFPILVGPFLIPYMGIKISLQTGWLYSVIGLYPPFDSIGFMIIVAEYSEVIKRLFRCASSTHQISQITPSGHFTTTAF